jgi:long-subunit fatty acid transport protein
MVNESGTDKLTYPWNYKLGLGLHPTERIVIGVDYEVRSNADATYQVGATQQNPWLDSQIFRVGLEYKVADRFMLRGGYREDVQSYAEEGAAIVTDPIRGSVYTVGCGITWSKFEISLAYEYAYTKYVDAWESNVNYNSREAHMLAAELGYHF